MSQQSEGKRNLKNTISIQNVHVNYRYIKSKSDGNKHRAKSTKKSACSTGKRKSRPSVSGGSEEKVLHKPFFQFNPVNSKNIMTSQKVYDYAYCLSNQNSSAQKKACQFPANRSLSRGLQSSKKHSPIIQKLKAIKANYQTQKKKVPEEGNRRSSLKLFLQLEEQAHQSPGVHSSDTDQEDYETSCGALNMN